MPRFDGTGPAGMGPMTGGGRGWCTPYGPTYRGYGAYPAPPPAYYSGYPPARGAGRPRWGLGQGWGQRPWGGRGRRRRW
jgi:hypothetical protein